MNNDFGEAALIAKDFYKKLSTDKLENISNERYRKIKLFAQLYFDIKNNNAEYNTFNTRFVSAVQKIRTSKNNIITLTFPKISTTNKNLYNYNMLRIELSSDIEKIIFLQEAIDPDFIILDYWLKLTKQDLNSETQRKLSASEFFRIKRIMKKTFDGFFSIKFILNSIQIKKYLNLEYKDTLKK